MYHHNIYALISGTQLCLICKTELWFWKILLEWSPMFGKGITMLNLVGFIPWKIKITRTREIQNSLFYLSFICQDVACWKYGVQTKNLGLYFFISWPIVYIWDQYFDVYILNLDTSKFDIFIFWILIILRNWIFWYLKFNIILILWYYNLEIWQLNSS